MTIPDRSPIHPGGIPQIYFLDPSGISDTINPSAPVIDLDELFGRQRALNTPANVTDAQTSFVVDLVEDVMGRALTGEENRILRTGIESTNGRSLQP
jgi:hypothetical protein